MTENYHQPMPDDAVLGGQNSQPLNAVVLGGMKGVKQRLANGNVKQKTLALEEALKYGQEGLELLMRSLKDEEWQVRHTSYALLQENVDFELKQALQKHNPYLQPIYCQTLIGRSGSVNSLAFSPDGSTLASCSYDNTIKLWDMGSGRLKSTLTGHSSAVCSIAFSPDGSTLASGGLNKIIELWDMGSGRLKSTLTGHSSAVYSIAFSPDGSILASGSSILAKDIDDEPIRLWELGNLNQSKLDLVKFFHYYIALKEVLNSGQVGLDQVIQALKGESWEVHEAAYSLLLARKEPRVKEALQEYNRCELRSAVKVDYARLRYLLATQRWTEAEEETEDIMLKISCQKKDVDVNRILDPRTQFDILTNIEDKDFTIENGLKCRIVNQDLNTIYALWREYSNLYSDSFSQQTLGLNFWMTVKNKLEEIFARQKRVISDY